MPQFLRMAKHCESCPSIVERKTEFDLLPPGATWLSLILFLTLCIGTAQPAWAEPANVFNQLVMKRAELEKRHGITSLECFPFIKNIGSDADQARWVARCHQAVQTLARALDEAPNPDLKTVGISTRFLRVGGFHARLIRWDASPAEMVRALQENLSPEERNRFLEKIYQLKKTIQSQLSIRNLYCSQNISNDQCMQGYATLASVKPAGPLARKRWREVVVTDSTLPQKDPSVLPLRFNDSASAMADSLQNLKAQDIWNQRRPMYEEIQKKYGAGFRKLQLANFFCALDLTREECILAASNLNEASQDPTLRGKDWGEALAHRYNTLIRNDYDLVFRFDLPPRDIIRIFSDKPSKAEVQASVTRVETLETRTRNNAAGLRAVCDLVDLRSPWCVQGFENFLKFLRTYREYSVNPPWTELMFIDGRQLSRVNFALNSKMRTTYLYIDVHTRYDELEKFLFHFRHRTAGPPASTPSGHEANDGISHVPLNPK